MSVTHASVTEAALTALANGQNRDPFAVLGPHQDESGRGLVIRTFQPAARAVEVRLPDGGLVPMSRRAPPGAFEAVVGADVHGLPAARDLLRRSRRRVRRSVSIWPRAHRLRSASARRRHAHPCVREARRAPPHGWIDHRRALRGVGAERRAREPDRRLQRLGRPRPRDAAAPAERHLGDLRSRSPGRREVQVRDPHPSGRPAEEERSLRRRVRSAAALGVGRQGHLRLPVGRRRLDDARGRLRRLARIGR